MTYQRRKDARPGEILDAAFEAFIENSFAKTYMSDIAKRAGISRPTLYLYFDSKETIFAALIEDRLAPVIQNQMDLLSSGQVPAKTQLKTTLRLIIHQITKPDVAPLLRLLITEVPFFPELVETYKAQIVDPRQWMLSELITRGVEEGSFGNHALGLDPKTLVAPALMSVVWTSLFGENDAIDTAKLTESYITVILLGLGADS